MENLSKEFKKNKKKKVLVIWDLDGTVFDTEYEVSKITADLAVAGFEDQAGVDIDADTVFRDFAGLGPVEKFVKISEAYGANWTAEATEYMGKTHEENKAKIYDRPSLPFTNNIKETLADMEANDFAICVGSTNPTQRSKKGLTKMNIDNYFGNRIYGPNLVNGMKKPKPDTFLLAKNKNPANYTFVIEDSEPGIVAAKKANAVAIAYMDDRFEGSEEKVKSFKEAGADIIISDHSKIIPAIEAYINKFEKKLDLKAPSITS